MKAMNLTQILDENDRLKKEVIALEGKLLVSEIRLKESDEAYDNMEALFEESSDSVKTFKACYDITMAEFNVITDLTASLLGEVVRARGDQKLILALIHSFLDDIRMRRKQLHENEIFKNQEFSETELKEGE